MLPFMQMASRRGVRRDFYVVHHVPVGQDGNDYYAAYRARNRGFSCYIGFTMFETDRLPPGWADACNGMDEIWVPSRFNQETFSASGVDPDKLHVIPLGFDGERFLRSPPPLSIPGKRGFTFLSLFQWSPRKGADLLIRAFLETFESREEVCLVIRSSGMQGESVQDRLIARIRSLGRDLDEIPSIVLIDHPVPEKDLPALYAAADAFVLPSRGEGWGIPYIEAMASGLPVIGTRWSGNTEFMHDGNSFLIDIEGLVPVQGDEGDPMSMYTGHRYAEPSLAHLKALLREVYEDQDQARARGAGAREEVLAKWTRARSAEAMTARFRAWRSRISASAAAGSSPLPRVELQAPVPVARAECDPFRSMAEALSTKPEIPDLITGAGTGECKTQPAFLHQGDPTRFRLDHGRALHIGRTAFPTDALPKAWVNALNRLDEVWVPSGFNLRSFIKAGVDPDKVVTVPLAVDAYRFGPHLEKRGLGPDLGFIFLSMLSWRWLKGWDVLVEAFCRAFSPQDQVTLFLKVMPDPAMPLARIENALRDFIRNRLHLEPNAVPRIKLSGTPLTREDMPLLYRAADAFVLPSRGEGYGQALLEAMASGLPTIATGWSGHLEFMNERNAWLLGFEKVPVPRRGVAENQDLEGHSWAEPALDDLCTCMQEVFENHGCTLERAMRAREEVAEKFSIERTANLVDDRLGVLAGGRRTGSSDLQADRKVRIVLEGAFSIMSSTALVNREMGRALMARDRVSLAARPVTDGESFEGNDRYFQLEAAMNKRFLMPAQIHAWHQWPPSAAAPSAGKWIIFQGWEYGSLPKKMHALFRSGPDEIWTYSSYCAREFEADGIPREQIQVIPLGVDPSRYHPDAEIPDRLKSLSSKKVVFLFVGGTVWRKGIDLLLSAYCRAFTRQDDVALVIKEMGSDSFYQDFNLTGAVERLARTPRAPEIILIDEELGDDEMPGLYKSCTCLVHPYRGEGFGLPVLEAMACGLPVIVTAGGACDDFARGEGIFPLPALRKEIALPLETVRPAWVLEPDKNALIQTLRKVAENPSESIVRAREASESVRTDWTWERSAARVESRCIALADKFQA